MTDYKSPLNRNSQIHFEDDHIRDSNPIATLVWIVVFMGLSIFMLKALVDAIVKESENQATYYRQGVEYSRPAAYRKTTPTAAQMWALESMNEVSKVAHAERNGK